MKLSISNIAWKPPDVPDVLAVLRELGVSHLEVAPTLLLDDPYSAPRSQVEEVRETYRDQGFELVAMQSLVYGRDDLQLFQGNESRAKLTDYLRRIIEFGGALGVGPLVFGSPKNRRRGDLGDEEALDIAVPFFTELATIASNEGCVLCIEPNAADYGCDFVNTMPEAVELATRVDHSGLGINGDAGVMTMNGEDYAASLDLAGRFLAHVHISEPFLNPTTEQKTDHAQLAAALVAREHDKFVSIEMVNRSERPSADVVRECVQFALETYFANGAG